MGSMQNFHHVLFIRAMKKSKGFGTRLQKSHQGGNTLSRKAAYRFYGGLEHLQTLESFGVLERTPLHKWLCFKMSCNLKDAFHAWAFDLMHFSVTLAKQHRLVNV